VGKETFSLVQNLPATRCRRQPNPSNAEQYQPSTNFLFDFGALAKGGVEQIFCIADSCRLFVAVDIAFMAFDLIRQFDEEFGQ
jgi:hypothetical protein